MDSNLPSGTVTFLFTDIEGSTRLWQEQPDAMALAHARHDAIVRAAIEANHGYVLQVAGDSFKAAFHNAPDGLLAVVAAQRALQQSSDGLKLRARMGLHTGTAEIAADGNYDGYTTIASAQRVMSAAQGGQILLTQTTFDLLQNALPAEVSLKDLGEHRLKDLRAPLRLYQVNAPELPQNFPSIQSLDAFPNNLPVQLTSFVGREKEIAEIQGLLHDARLVTLTGSGGTGKTRLSIQAGMQELANFPNGVWLIELAPLSDPAQIIPALAQVFGLQEVPLNPLVNSVTDYLRDKKLLLLLDNCEHLIAACAQLADDLLHHCAGLKILASSREALGIGGEVAYRTPSLANAESTRLFVERARAANPKFSLTEANAPAVAQICTRLDGIPLAIELAAARTKLFSVDQIAARLVDLFRLLVGGSRTALPRQQTLRALIDWSYDLLPDQERQLLRTASVFVGGWTLDAIEAVSQDPDYIEHLEGLVNKSLVFTEERNNAVRYFLLETIRQYAREKLFEMKEAAAARDGHLRYFEKFSEMGLGYAWANALFMRDMAGDELDNLRAALEWGLAHDAEAAVHLATNFCDVLSWFGKHTEGQAALQAAIDKVNALPPAEGEALVHRQKLMGRAFATEATAAILQGDINEVMPALQKAIELSRLTGDRAVLGFSLTIYSSALDYNQLPGGTEAAAEGLAILSELGDRTRMFYAILHKDRIAMFRGGVEDRQMYLQKTEELIKGMPISIEAAYFYLVAGQYERYRGDYRAARAYYEQGLQIFQQFGNRLFENVMRSELGHVARLSGDVQQAKAIYRQTLVVWQDLGARGAIANQLECFAFLAVAEEETAAAAKLLGAAEALREQAQSQMTDLERGEYDQSLTRLRNMLDETEFDTRWAEGRAMTLRQAIQFALDET